MKDRKKERKKEKGSDSERALDRGKRENIRIRVARYI